MNRNYSNHPMESPYKRATRAYEESRYDEFLTIVEREIPVARLNDFLIAKIEHLEATRNDRIGHRAHNILDRYVFG